MLSQGMATIDDIVNYYHTIYATSPLVHWLYSANFETIYYVSPSFETIWQRPCQEITQTPALWLHYLAEDQSIKQHPICNYHQEHGFVCFQYQITTPNNKTIDITEQAWPIMDKNKNIIAYSSISQQTTQNQPSQPSKTDDTEKMSFLAIIGHELRTPLNTMLGLSQLMMNSSLSSELREEYLQTIIHSAEQQKRIINDLLNYSVLEKGNFSLQQQWFSIYSLIEGLMHQFHPQAKLKKIKLERFNNCDPRIQAWGDSKRLYQIFANLISNAIKFTEHGKVSIIAQQKIIDDNQLSIEFTIEDTGCGIAKDQLPFIFQEFYQVQGIEQSPYVRQASGIGMGLCIVKKIIDQLNGQIKVESNLNQGTKFHCHLKLPVRQEIKSQENKKTIKNHILKQCNILIIEDNIINQKVMVKFLQSLGYNTKTAMSGTQALELLKNTQFDLALVDLSLPDMSGIDIATNYKKNHSSESSIPMIAVSAHTSSHDKQSCIDVGMIDFLEKPINFHELEQVIYKWLEPQVSPNEKEL